VHPNRKHLHWVFQIGAKVLTESESRCLQQASEGTGDDQMIGVAS